MVDKVPERRHPRQQSSWPRAIGLAVDRLVVLGVARSSCFGQHP
ncbi:MAG: hypothetical protein OES57_03810 [Acidimicrobiia bacterium]|nr:hypothetical protein [Acidimicrobiia bacterium]